MPNVAAVLNEEIRRLAKREIKANTSSTKGAVAQFRRDIAKLKRQMQTQAKEIAFLKAQEKKRLGEPQINGEKELDGVRFSARSVKAQRARLKLSAADYGKLVGVSGLTIYSWESGKSRPRPKQFAALVAVRGLGRREAVKKLEMLKADTKKVKKLAGSHGRATVAGDTLQQITICHRYCGMRNSSDAGLTSHGPNSSPRWYLPSSLWWTCFTVAGTNRFPCVSRVSWPTWTTVPSLTRRPIPPIDSSITSASWQKVSPTQSRNCEILHVPLSHRLRSMLLSPNRLSMTMLSTDCRQEGFTATNSSIG